MFLRKGVLKICSKFTVEYPCQSVILIKLQKTLLKSYFGMVVLQWICCKLNNTLELLYVAASDFQKVVGKRTVKKTNLRGIHQKNLLKLTECCHGKINRFLSNVSILHPFHCVKSVRIQSYSGLHFPTIGPNTKRYSVSLRTQSECEKMRTDQNNSKYGHFLCSVCFPGVSNGEIGLKWVYSILPWANPMEKLGPIILHAFLESSPNFVSAIKWNQ